MGLLERLRQRRAAARLERAPTPSTGIHLLDKHDYSKADADAFYDRAVQEGFEAELLSFDDDAGGGSWRVYLRRPGERNPVFSDEPGWQPLGDLPDDLLRE